MTKTISLSDSAYELLRKVKRNNESFSEVITRLVGKKGELTEIVSLYPELSSSEEYEESIKDVRKEVDKRLEHEMY